MIKLVALLVLVAVSAADPDIAVNVNGNTVSGERMTSVSGRGINAYKNIPYAEPPIGDLRFADPVPKKDPWTQQQQAGPIMCPQLDEYFLKAGYMGTEDCLVLNVYTPVDPGTRDLLPVMFFVHGGGFMSGMGHEILYGPELFLDEDVILVTGNYRLGAMGFLFTNTTEFSGNYGLKDQKMILKWIQDNIVNFNGDKNRVTLFGESAGSVSVAYHLISSGSQGLFQSAILQSGNPFDTWAIRKPNETIGFAEKLFEHFGCKYDKGDYSLALECMRGIDAKRITEAIQIHKKWDIHPMVIYTPVIEPPNAAVNPFITAKDLEDNSIGGNIPIIMGNTANEGCFWTAVYALKPEVIADLNEKFEKILPVNLFLFDRYDDDSVKKAAEKIKSYYLEGKNFNWEAHLPKLVDLLTVNNFLAGTTATINRRISAPADTYLYKFNYHGAVSIIELVQPQNSSNLGVCHADDLLYMFPVAKNLIPVRSFTEEDKQVQRTMVSLWTSFAKTGKPSANNIEWSPMHEYPLDYLRIGNCNLTICNTEKRTETVMEKGYFEESINFITDLYDILEKSQGTGDQELV